MKVRLSELGLSQYEIETYITLLKSGTLTAKKLVELSGIPHSRIYDVAQRLSEKGLIEIVEEKPRKFKPVDPEIALHAYIEREKKKLDGIYEDIVSLVKVLSLEAELEYKATWVISAKPGEVIVPLVKKSRYQLLLAAGSKDVDSLTPEIEMATKRGVNVTVISYGRPDSVERLIEAGVELYQRKASSITIALADTRAGVISDPRLDYSILTAEPLLVRALMDLFYSSLVGTSTLISRPERVRGRFVSIWSFIDRVRGGEKIKVVGVRVSGGERVVVEGVVKGKVVDDGIASLLVETKEGVIRVGGLGAVLEDVEGLLFEIVE